MAMTLRVPSEESLGVKFIAGSPDFTELLILRGNVQEPVKVVMALVEDPDGGGFVVLKRRDDHALYPGEFCLPGGVVERGEGVWGALEREVKEETGLSFDAGKRIGWAMVVRDEVVPSREDVLRPSEGDVDCVLRTQVHEVHVFRVSGVRGSFVRSREHTESRMVSGYLTNVGEMGEFDEVTRAVFSSLEVGYHLNEGLRGYVLKGLKDLYGVDLSVKDSFEECVATLSALENGKEVLDMMRRLWAVLVFSVNSHGLSGDNSIILMRFVVLLSEGGAALTLEDLQAVESLMIK